MAVEPRCSQVRITQILSNWSAGNQTAAAELFPLVYNEPRRNARRYPSGERAGHTPQTTSLIHKAYLKLIPQKPVNWESRTQFFAIASNLMRQSLVDHAMTNHRIKRGGAAGNLPVEEAQLLVAAAEK
jgi:RNA polymerase sigma factor (TIGR02999 family)